MNELDNIKLSIQDFLTKDILKISLYPLIITIVVLYTLFFASAGVVIGNLEQVQLNIQQHSTSIENGVVNEESSNETYTGNGVLDFLLKYSLTSYIASFLLYSLGIISVGYLSIFIAIFIIGFLTPKILSIIQKRHYNEIKLENNISFMESIFFLLKTIFITVLLFFLLMPLYFIPLVNIVAINLPFFYLFHKMLHFDVGRTILKKEEFDVLYYINKSKMRNRSLFLYILSLIPFIAIFLAVFYVIYLSHGYFKTIQIKNQTNNTLDYE